MRAVFARAFRTPSVLAVYAAYRLFAAWLLTAPVVAAFSSTGVRRLPYGDARLFEPGGLFAAEATRLALPSLGANAWTSTLTLLLLGYLGLVPLALLLLALRSDPQLPASPQLPAREWGGAALSALPKLTGLAALALAAQVALATSGALVLGPVASALQDRLAAPTADLLALSGGVLVLGLVLLIGIGHDLARAELFSGGTGIRVALRRAASLLRRRGHVLVSVWVAGLVTAGVLIALGAFATTALAVERAGAWRWLTALALHQGIVLTLVVLRALWFAYLFDASELSSREAPTRASDPEAPPRKPRGL